MLWVLTLVTVLLTGAALAQTFPQLTGRVVDQANLLSPQQEAALTQRLEALERANSRQLVVATIPSLQDYPIEDYGYRLGRAWGIGQRGANNGAILIVAPNEKRVRVEVGYGLEPILTDAFSNFVIQNRILPRFRADDYPGGIAAGVDSLIAQLQAPPELAERRAAEAAARQRQRGGAGGGESGSWLPLIFWAIIIAFILLPALFGSRRYGRRYGRRGWGGAPIILWGSGLGGGWGGGGGFGGGGGGFGGFSGGGGSFGGGGVSGSW